MANGLPLTSTACYRRGTEYQGFAAAKLGNFSPQPIYGGTSINQSLLFHLRPGLWQADVVGSLPFTLDRCQRLVKIPFH
jgi:hypothetical protein